jgi:mannose-6-phosphate isomerase-like protein (cupin superfamily)
MSSVLGQQAVVHQAGEGEENRAFSFGRRIRLTPEDTGGTFSVWEEEVPEGVGPPLHVHHDAQELFVVLEGRVLFRCSGRNAEVGAGGTALIPRGAEHTFKALTAARILVELVPGRGIGFFREVEAQGLTPERDMERIAAIARDYDLEFVGPPL